eukprot:SAG31_NODE_161_length_21899_cov_16.832844_6_plen_34_part_00
MANFMSKQLSWQDDLDSFPVPAIGAGMIHYDTL